MPLGGGVGEDHLNYVTRKGANSLNFGLGGVLGGFISLRPPKSPNVSSLTPLALAIFLWTFWYGYVQTPSVREPAPLEAHVMFAFPT